MVIPDKHYHDNQRKPKTQPVEILLPIDLSEEKNSNVPVHIHRTPDRTGIGNGNPDEQISHHMPEAVKHRLLAVGSMVSQICLNLRIQHADIVDGFPDVMCVLWTDCVFPASAFERKGHCRNNPNAQSQYNQNTDVCFRSHRRISGILTNPQG